MDARRGAIPKGVLLGVLCATALGALVLGSRAFFASPAPPADTDQRRWVTVEKIRSGGKIIVKPRDEVIYAGIRAPFPDEPLFEESKARNTALVLDKKVRLRFDEIERDKKGRLMAYAFVGKACVNGVLVREGLAFARISAAAKRFENELLAAQAQARRKRRGIWKTPWAPTAARLIGDSKYGNLHCDTCEELKNIGPERRVELSSLDDAFERGFAPCSKCKPCKIRD